MATALRTRPDLSRARVLFLSLFLAFAQWLGAESGRIGTIEFFGYKGLDVQKIRSRLPVRPGDPYDDILKLRLRKAVLEAIGKQPTDVAAICCDEHGNHLLFIGLPGASFRSFAFNPRPTGTERLPVEIVNFYARLDGALQAAVARGGTAEDDSTGYALAKDPDARSLQIAVRAWAVQHDYQILRVLRFSSSVDHRRIASDALGYAQQTGEQISGLVQAARDPDGEVRNNATRALTVLTRSKPSLADRIPADTFIAMLNSGLWTDRNKAAAVLVQLTASRSPNLLARIRSESYDAIAEMARWTEPSHAFSARIILGRIQGIPETQLQKFAWHGPVEGIVNGGGK